MKWHILITCKHLQDTFKLYESMFNKNNIEVEMPVMKQQLSELELLEIIDRFDGVIAGDDHFTEKVLKKGKRLKIIAKWGIGIDGIDLVTARNLGIQVLNTPDVFANEVADVVMGYIIMLSRQLHKIHDSVKRGEWLKIQGKSLWGKKIGVIGVGSIGKAVVKRSIALGMEVIGHDINGIQQSFVNETGIIEVGFEELLKTSDFISLNCTLTPKNHHLLSFREFAIMKDGAFIINTSRGKLIDEMALICSIKQGKIAGAALDVFEKEPIENDELRQFDNCIFGSHNSSNTSEAVLRVNQMAIKNLFVGLGVATS